MTTEKMNFGADVSRLLDIVAHALYSNRDIFLRELISNAADACDRLRYEAISKPALTKGGPDFNIRVFKDIHYRNLTVLDNGIGMTREELAENLGTIAKSGTASLVEQMKSAGDNKDKLSLIGQFGVGFYACFMVCKKVQVISRKAGEKQAWHWESDGKTGFEIREATDEEATILSHGGGRGTAIIMTINDDASEYILDDKLKLIIQTYSDHIGFPIYLGHPDVEERKKMADAIKMASEEDKEKIKEEVINEKPVNSASALWMRSPSEVTPEQYTEFYHHIGHGYDEPVLTAHWRAEGKIEFSALLFVPTMRPWDLYDPTRRHAVRLYVKRVFITDECETLMFPWLRFVRGVIDSEDLPLNISREMLQHNPVINRIRSSVARRILSDLAKLAENDKPAFESFWHQFGAALKEGLYDAPDHREGIFKVARFFSTYENGEKLTSLDEYVERMPEDQDKIYYISGENLETLKNSPQLEGFKSRGIEVLFFTDTIDDFWLQMVADYKDKQFKSVTKGDIELPQDDEKQEDKAQTDKKEPEGLIGALKELLKDEVSDVRISKRLTDSPVCLIASEKGVDMRMERVLRIHQHHNPPEKRILEINPNHPLICRMEDMAAQNPEGPDVQDAAWLLLDQARIIQGEPVPDPAAFARRMAQFMERGLAAA